MSVFLSNVLHHTTLIGPRVAQSTTLLNSRHSIAVIKKLGDQPRSFATISNAQNSNQDPRVSNVITATSVQALFNKQLYAIVIPGFLDEKICGSVSEKLLDGRIQDYTNAPGIGRIGISFYETTNQPEMEREYFEKAIDNIQELRKIFAPYHSPIDHLRVLLDETWPTGANLATRGGKKMFAGLCRALSDGNGILPHEDKFERDDPLEAIRSTIQAQIAVNLYLQTPEKGGALELYAESLNTDEYDALRKDSYGIDRDLLPPPEITIKPAAGDLVMFNSRRLHAVTDSIGKTRLSVSCFFGLKENNAPLKFWS